MNSAERARLRELGARKRCASCGRRDTRFLDYCPVMGRCVQRDELACLEWVYVWASTGPIQLKLI